MKLGVMCVIALAAVIGIMYVIIVIKGDDE